MYVDENIYYNNVILFLEYSMNKCADRSDVTCLYVSYTSNNMKFFTITKINIDKKCLYILI